MYANEAAIGALGYSLSSLLKMEAHEIDLSMAPQIGLYIGKSSRHGRTLAFETRYRTFCRPEVPVEIRSNYLRFGAQEYNCSFVHDIT